MSKEKLKAVIHKVDGGQKPVRSTNGSACFDVFARKIERVSPFYYKVYVGIKSDIPEGFMAELSPRSSITDTGWGMANSIGIIDSDFKYEWQARFRPFYNGEVEKVFPYKVGDRVAQFRIVKDNYLGIEGVTLLTNERKGGHGHTGK